LTMLLSNISWGRRHAAPNNNVVVFEGSHD
jgi:hypothetical protein